MDSSPQEHRPDSGQAHPRDPHLPTRRHWADEYVHCRGRSSDSKAPPQPNKRRRKARLFGCSTWIPAAAIGAGASRGFRHLRGRRDEFQGTQCRALQPSAGSGGADHPGAGRNIGPSRRRRSNISWSGPAPPSAQGSLPIVSKRTPVGGPAYIVVGEVEPSAQGSYLDKTFAWEKKYEYRIATLTEVRSQGLNASVPGRRLEACRGIHA